jgi:2-isopropylmalate synthase
VRRITREVRGPVIAGLARVIAEDIDQCWEAIKEAEHPRIHTFLSSSDIHLESQFKLRREEAKARAVEMVRRAAQELVTVS